MAGLWVSAAACAGAIPPALEPDAQLAAALREVAGESFRIRETDHFTIAYDVPHEVLRGLVDRLEGTFNAVWRFCEAGGLPVHPPRQRLAVIFFDRVEDLQRYAERTGLRTSSAEGFYDQGTNRAVFANALNRPDMQRLTEHLEQLQARIKAATTQPGSADSAQVRGLQSDSTALRGRRDLLVRKINQLVVQHEAAHHVLFNIGVHARGQWNPPWLAEGLATQFEVLQGSAAGGKLAVNHVRLADLREAIGVERKVSRLPEAELAAAFADGRVVGVQRLVSDPAVFLEKAEDVARRYAEANALVLYLSRKRPEALARYLEQMGRRAPGPPPSAAGELADFEAAFGPVDDVLNREWLRFVLQLPFDPQQALR